MPRLVLASTSPRRRQLLEQVRLDFDVVAPDYDEVMDESVSADTLAMALASGKAASVADGLRDALVIGADTFITHEGRYLGKPSSADEARATLRRLRGTSHEVITGLAVIDTDHRSTFTFCSTSRVWLRAITDDDIERYLTTGEPMDKAAGYATQGIGGAFVERIEGDMSAVIGLPLSPLCAHLATRGVNFAG